MTTIVDLRVPRPAGGSLHLHYRRPDGHRQAAVVFSHGFSVDGTESHRMFLRMAQRYNEVGIATVNFDYFGCGYSDGDFSEFSVSGAVSDLDTVIDWVKRQPDIDPSHIVVHGQSLGTAIATVMAAHRADVHAFVFWNLSADLSRRYQGILGEEFFRTGQVYLPDKGLRVRRDFYEDLSQYDVLRYFEGWTRPTLFVSSGSDVKGEPALAEKASVMTGTHGVRVVIDGANHSFKAQPDLEDGAMRTTLEWVLSEVQPAAR